MTALPPSLQEIQTLLAHHSTLPRCNLHFLVFSNFFISGCSRKERKIRRWGLVHIPAVLLRKDPRCCYMASPKSHWPEISHMVPKLWSLTWKSCAQVNILFLWKREEMILGGIQQPLLQPRN